MCWEVKPPEVQISRPQQPLARKDARGYRAGMPGDKDPKTIDDQEKPRRIGNIEALKAEVEITRDNARVALETDGGTIEGYLVKTQDSFGIKMDNGDFAEFALRPETMAGNLPEGIDRNTSLHVRATKADRTSSEYWSKPIRNFRQY